MLIKDGSYSDSVGLSIRVDNKYEEVLEGYSKIDGKWVPWDVPGQGDIDLSLAVKYKKLDGLTLVLSHLLKSKS